MRILEKFLPSSSSYIYKKSAQGLVSGIVVEEGELILRNSVANCFSRSGCQREIKGKE